MIYKLLEQYQLQTQPGQMMMTAQMLLTELQQCELAAAQPASKTVTVVIPAVAQPAPEPVLQAHQPVVAETVAVSSPPFQPQQPYQPYQHYQSSSGWQQANPAPATHTHTTTVQMPAATAPVQQTAFVQQVVPMQQAVPMQQVAPVQQHVVTPMPVTPVMEEEAPAPQPAIPSVPPAPVQQSKGWQFDPVHDVPTLIHQQDTATAVIYDINDRITAATKSESLNERLRVEKIELGSVLQESPIRDLKKAIGINDRYLFINELFRGDETMYERSLKTINGFNILPEAQYWIQRELKVKLGWNEHSEAVAHFDQLVKRRFT
ncbi:hypothetical protein FLA_0662 [Filimonas lacunae]|nr:hypothetical protein FLA_0662 [Filimonas lacunae]